MAELDILIKAREITRQAFAKVGRNADEMTGSLDRGAEASARLGKGLNIAAAAGGAALVGLGKAALDNATELANLGRLSGATGERLQVLAHIARDSGGSAEDVADAYREMQLRLSEASQLASGPAVDALRLLGLSIDELEGRHPDEQFDILRDAIAGVKDPADRLFAAEELLGGASERLAAVIGPLSGDFDELARSVEASGVVMSEETIRRLDEANKRIDEFMTAVTITVGDGIAVISQVVDEVPDFFEDAWKEIATTAERYFGITIGNTEEELTNLERLVGETGQQAADSIRDSTDAAIAHVQTGIDALHYRGTQSLINFEAANTASADVTVTEWEIAYSGVLETAQETARGQIEAAKAAALAAQQARDLIARGDETGGGLDSRAFERHQNRQRIEQAFANIPLLQSDGAYPVPGTSGGAGRSAGGGRGADDGPVMQLLETIEDWQSQTAEQALITAEAQVAALTQGADADGKRTLAERQLISAADGQAEQLRKLLGIADDQRTLLQRQLDGLQGLDDWAELTATEAVLIAQDQLRQLQHDIDSDGRRTVVEQQLLDAARGQLDAVERLFNLEESKSAGTGGGSGSGGFQGDTLRRGNRYFRQHVDQHGNIQQREVGRPLPQAASGGVVERTGVAVIHRGETITPAHQAGGPPMVHIHNRLEIDGAELRATVLEIITDGVRSGELSVQSDFS
ncbi:hypothetical protein F4Y93_12215 [Candidatus Poribacteria bacterium]|nr:hypothetical protein [Candidatus Poribacteria bacterium]